LTGNRPAFDCHLDNGECHGIGGLALVSAGGLARMPDGDPMIVMAKSITSDRNKSGNDWINVQGF
jgi:hypothetical protein